MLDIMFGMYSGHLDCVPLSCHIQQRLVQRPLENYAYYALSNFHFPNR